MTTETSNAPSSSWTPHMRWRLAMVTAVVAALAVGASSWLIARERARVLDAWRRELDAEAARSADVAQLWLHERMADAAVLADSPITERALAHGGAAEIEQLTRVLDRMRASYGYVEIFALASEPSRVIASPAMAVPDSVRAAVARVRPEGTAHVELLDAGAHLGILAPVRGAAAAAVVLEMDPSERLYPLLSSPARTATGETLLVLARGSDIVFVSPRRDGAGEGSVLALAADPRLAAVAATRGTVGSDEYLDYRGAAVLASTRGVGVAGWGIVAKVDRAEALEPLARYARIAWGLSGLVVLAATALGAAFIYRARVRFLAVALERERAQEASASERRRLEAQLVQAQKMEAVGRLAGGIAHDFNNLLTLVLVAADDLVAGLPASSSLKQDAADIKQAAVRATDLTRQLLTFSRKNVHRREPIELNDALRAVRSLLQRAVREDVEIAMTFGDGGAWCTTDRTQLEQALLNLVVNAKDAMPKGGRITITTRIAAATAAPPGMAPTSERCVIVDVGDTGEGIAPESLDKIFDPFFTTKPQGQGTGLGLAMVYSFMAQSGGAVQVASELGKGSTFSLWFPAAAPAPLPRTATPAAQLRPAGGETILVVDDSPDVRMVAVRVLRGAGFAVLEADGGAQALALYDQHGRSIAAVLSDVVMPGMGGRALCDALRAKGCTAPLVFMSGYADDEMLRADIDATRARFIHKPFTAKNLTSALRSAIDEAVAES